MKVSIITSCYNRQSTLRGCIESVLGQNYEDVEHIVVDGASTDGSMDIIREYGDRIARVISEPDGGMYEAINKGLRVATGDIIGLVHTDDLLYDYDTVSRVAYRFRLMDLDMVYGDGVFVDARKTDRMVRNWISGRYERRKVARGWLPLHTTVYVTRKWLDRCGLYDEQYKIAADTDWLVRSLYDMQPRVSYINSYLVRMRMGGLSTDPGKMKRKWSEDLRIYRSHGLQPWIALTGKVASKVPQFIEAKLK